ncbi:MULTISPECIES: 50S ribosomal protein L4 [Erysipelothrix]|uniref:Large ribosomal subunit protein uL4 n=2 Tax=Erysipelothrix TaxID=1647 RepID=A0A3Q8S2N2_9FIRM|nr:MULTISPECIES: 50S ribosomal protein L4 [Erysipelothrix]AZK44067.1 50S ribosomal protein L4 [Erysipelothrix piscisicarius]MBK2402802.1 50S ribosomal protein L4 [Erysipelothrix sp. strain 2 (EsS2-6-Brazil)]MBK2404107.1 50S ribosomal protein L4 [Erysipelothrix sp. strain 2 (EsS2-7-Brazil)]NBA01704.1 50S ribosomal protein L4 [Erysipelothrix rhusiopathiae]
MPKLDILNLEGKSLRELELNEAVFGIEPNNQTIFEAVVMQQASLRQGTHKTKNRTEVRGGGRKPWRQKGTGRARQGSIRSPQWRGGGVVFGPTPRSYKYSLNRKVRRLALRSALSQKVMDSEMSVVENLTVANVKTKEFITVMDALKLNKKTLFVVSAEENVDNAYLSMRNLSNTMMLDVQGLNVYDIVNCDQIVFTEKAAIEAGEVLA